MLCGGRPGADIAPISGLDDVLDALNVPAPERANPCACHLGYDDADRSRPRPRHEPVDDGRGGHHGAPHTGSQAVPRITMAVGCQPRVNGTARHVPCLRVVSVERSTAPASALSAGLRLPLSPSAALPHPARPAHCQPFRGPSVTRPDLLAHERVRDPLPWTRRRSQARRTQPGTGGVHRVAIGQPPPWLCDIFTRRSRPTTGRRVRDGGEPPRPSAVLFARGRSPRRIASPTRAGGRQWRHRHGTSHRAQIVTSLPLFGELPPVVPSVRVFLDISSAIRFPFLARFKGTAMQARGGVCAYRPGGAFFDDTGPRPSRKKLPVDGVPIIS